MSSQLTVTQARELLESLKAAVQEGAAAEEKLNKDFRQKIDATEKRFKEEIDALDAQLATQRNESEAAFADAKVRFQSRDEKRTARITRARKSSQKLAAQRIDDEEGHWKHKSQKGLLDTKRWRTDSLALNDTKLGEFNQQAGENRGAFAELEQAVEKVFQADRDLRDARPDDRIIMEQMILALTASQA